MTVHHVANAIRCVALRQHVAPEPINYILETKTYHPPTPNQTHRFMPPVTPSMWRNVRLADRFSPVCPQRSPLPDADGPDSEQLHDIPRSRLLQLRRLLPLLANQSEDCLYLNIYVPRSGECLCVCVSDDGRTGDTIVVALGEVSRFLFLVFV